MPVIMKSEKGGRQMATIKEVAEAAQVSAATVSRVLNKDDSISVSPEVRMRIFQAAQDVYKRQGEAGKEYSLRGRLWSLHAGAGEGDGGLL